ncbi:MAG: 4-hydroxy-3-methylbut-2-enyl diphosphate reductase [Paludibacteraceae bacterium]|nr:4-hydroxy-3-methylbut-2-enyl diphosphate reductase [Paludibacteraceae bacterium]
MQITIDTDSGFCFGVTSAIKKAEEELQRGPLSCLGDIVHNGQEVDRLEKAGLTTIDYQQLESIHGERVLLRAHGEPPSTYRIARNNGIEIIDATCPVVKKLQERIRTTYEQHPNAQIIIFGKVGHAEVIGLEGQTDNTAIVIESIADLNKIDFNRDIYLFSQTTKSVDEFNRIVNAIQAQRAALKIQPSTIFIYHDTICRNVANRVDKLTQFAKQQDWVVFVGGKKSSNAKVLFEHCRMANANTIFVSSPDELTALPISPSAQIGICGATSTPLWLMEQCKEKLLNIYNYA